MKQGTMDGLNDFRTTRVAEILSDFQSLQHLIASIPIDPPNMDDYYTEGWALLRRCHLDGQCILNRGADTAIPRAAGPGEEERRKAELKQVLLDAFSRRHEAHKIFLRQSVAQRWMDSRDLILFGDRPSSRTQSALSQCDHILRHEISQITEESVYLELDVGDFAQGRWTAEDPSLRAVQRWLRTQR